MASTPWIHDQAVLELEREVHKHNPKMVGVADRSLVKTDTFHIAHPKWKRKGLREVIKGGK